MDIGQDKIQNKNMFFFGYVTVISYMFRITINDDVNLDSSLFKTSLHFINIGAMNNILYFYLGAGPGGR